MATNNFLPFCPTNTGTNLLSQSDYAAASDRTNGNQPGIASAKLVNKSIRQSSFITSQIAQYVADKTGSDVLDVDGETATILALMNAALLPKKPTVQKFTSGSGTYNKNYVFRISTGSATVGATYTNNAITFTVSETVASGLVLIASGSGAPAASGTLTKASGTGDATITFQAVTAPLYLKVRAIGGGGGGGGAGTIASGGAGGNGGDTTFGTSLLTASGGSGGSNTVAQTGGAGGAASLGTGPVGTALTGGSGGGSATNATTGGAVNGAMGASTPFGGGGGGGGNSSGGLAAPANTGAGGGGGAAASGGGGVCGGTGGGAGGYVDAIIYSPAATYAYGVGAAGAAGSIGTGGTAGAAGGSGYIEVTEHYQ